MRILHLYPPIASDSRGRPPPRLHRSRDGHLSLHCGPSRRRKLKVWMLLRLRYGLSPQLRDERCWFVRGDIRLQVQDGAGLSLVSDSDIADVLLRRLCAEL